jgi:hypothetical protein
MTISSIFTGGGLHINHLDWLIEARLDRRKPKRPIGPSTPRVENRHSSRVHESVVYAVQHAVYATHVAVGKPFELIDGNAVVPRLPLIKNCLARHRGLKRCCRRGPSLRDRRGRPPHKRLKPHHTSQSRACDRCLRELPHMRTRQAVSVV